MKYHKKTGLPNSIFIPDWWIHLIYSLHAVEKLREYKVTNEPVKIKLTKENIVELTTINNTAIESAVVRLLYNDEKDIIISLLLFRRTAVIKTVWLNNKVDDHETLDKSKYDIPDNYNSKEIDQIYAGR